VEDFAGHAFISYVREDSGEVDRLQRILEAAGIPVWRDTANLWPGENWSVKIKDAITRDALVFIAGNLDAIFELALGWPTAISHSNIRP